jgi:hypothetical protein
MTAGIGFSSRFICKWQSDSAPHFETRIGYNDDKTKIVASLINTSTGAIVDSKILSLLAVFEHCVWKANDLPAHALLESRLFRTYTSKKASWVGVDLNSQRLHIVPYTQFDNDRLKTYAPVYNHETQQVEYQMLSSPRTEACDPQAEKGIVRPTNAGEERIVHIWDHVGENGENDLRLIHRITGRTQGTQEALILRLFYRASGMSGSIALTNRSPTLVDEAFPIHERIIHFVQHPEVILEGRCGNAYSSVTLSSSTEIPLRYQEFFQGRKLQAVSTQELSQYIRDRLFVLRDPEGQVQGMMKYHLRVTVERHQAYDFGSESGKLSAIQIHMSDTTESKWGLLPFKAIVSFLSGMFNCEAPKIHRLEGLNTVAMEDLLLESPHLRTGGADPRKISIFQEFEKTLDAGADINYYIAENRKAARFCFGGFAFELRSGCTTLGRYVTLRDFWEKPNQKAFECLSSKSIQFVPEEQKK